MKRHKAARMPSSHDVNSESALEFSANGGESGLVKAPATGQTKPDSPRSASAPVICANMISLGASPKGQIRVAFFDCG